MAILSFTAMYILMYAMVDEFASVYSNANQAYAKEFGYRNNRVSVAGISLEAAHR